MHFFALRKITEFKVHVLSNTKARFYDNVSLYLWVKYDIEYLPGGNFICTHMGCMSPQTSSVLHLKFIAKAR